MRSKDRLHCINSSDFLGQQPNVLSVVASVMIPGGDVGRKSSEKFLVNADMNKELWLVGWFQIGIFVL